MNVIIIGCLLFKEHYIDYWKKQYDVINITLRKITTKMLPHHTSFYLIPLKFPYILLEDKLYQEDSSKSCSIWDIARKVLLLW